MGNNFQENDLKSINSQTNIKILGNDNLISKFCKQLSNEPSPILWCLSISYLIIFTSVNPDKILASWVLAIKQETYLSYIKKVIKKILQITVQKITFRKVWLSLRGKK